MSAIFPGTITMWHGAIVDIPVGWVLCDGNNGTPDLRDKFIMGAAGVAPPGATGGNTTHAHDFTGDGHSHGIPSGYDIASGANFYDETGYGEAEGRTDPQNNLPPYHALCYIMKT